MLCEAFQFTHPGRGATVTEAMIMRWICVSIHAPREGCDLGGRLLATLSELWFQFTHPGRGATTAGTLSFQLFLVSIHAPREGCDTYKATACQRTACFNSRTPGGVRLRGSVPS